ncbi:MULTISPECIES: type IV pilus modification PilV family protein [Vibrio]|nr:MULTISPECIES: type II secretion system protein [Vibrio]
MTSKYRSPFVSVTCRQTGFTLIESIVAMVIMGLAMTVLFSLFFPRVENSGIPQYQVRASALGQSMMNTILSRGFDDNSDPSGGIYRCDENDVNNQPNPCTTKLGAETDKGETDASFFNDVDDYIGCWYTSASSKALCSSLPEKPLTDILGKDIATQYPNFVVDVTVTNMQSTAPHVMRKIKLNISASQFEAFKLTAYRGNY